MIEPSTTETITAHWRTIYNQFIKKSKKDKAARIKAICYPPWPLLFNRISVFFEHFFAKQLFRDFGSPLYKKKILEIGCGTARWCELFLDYGGKVLGTDLFQDLLNENQRRLPEVAFCAMSATELALKNETVDFVSVATVLQLIPRSKKALALHEISRVLCPKGKVFILEALGSEKNREGSHYSLLSRQEWETLLIEQGFHVIAQKSLHAYPLAHFYKKLVSWIGVGIKIIKGQSKSKVVLVSTATSQAGYNAKPAKRHLFYHFLDQNMLRLIACLSFPLEFVWLALGGKGSHQMYLVEKIE